MLYLQAAVLGLVQGLTEFVPVSSTAHLILIPWLFGWTLDPNVAFAFDVLLQLGTLVAVLVYYAKDLQQIFLAMVAGIRQGKPFEDADARLGWLVIVATIPGAIIGLLFKKYFEALHRLPVIVALILLAAASLLFLVEFVGKRNRNLTGLGWPDAFLIGCSQALALVPGVSRSAATISGGLLRGLDRPAAARFSFLMSIPIMLAAGVVATKDLVDIPNFTALLPPLALGFVISTVVGFISITWLLNYLSRHSMIVFAWYRILFGAVCLAIAFWRL